MSEDSYRRQMAAERSARMVCRYLSQELSNTTNPDVIAALKRVGRHILLGFDWTMPIWAGGYNALFQED